MSQIKQEKYHKQTHSVYDCRYHLVWVTKYRFKVIDPEIELALKWSIKDTCDWKGIEILEGSVKEEHVHLYLQVPPRYSISDTVKWLKGKSATKLLQKFPKLAKQYWGRHLWARGYFVSTVGITDDTIRKYIQDQRQDEFNLFNQTWK